MSNIFDKLRQYGFIKTFQFALSELTHLWFYQKILGSYSQKQEDLVIDKLVNYKKNGFYIDIGAFDPYRFSNTMRFYKRGWHGINIEPNNQYWRRFQKHRHRDINLNIGIGLKNSHIKFYSIDPPTLSTFQKDQAFAYIRQGFHLLKTVDVSVYPLKQVLKKYLKERRIDFMSIDVEGMELQVLRSNDWNTYRPYLLCIESAGFLKSKISGQYQMIDTFLRTVKYKLVYNNGLNSFYKDIRV